MGAESTFLFADIAGYTALTEAHGDEHAAATCARFFDEVSELVEPQDGEVVKTIGDAVMLRMAVPTSAVALGLRIAHEVLTEHEAPTVRVGMHHGPAVERAGDWFGSTVNLAARVAELAAGGEVLVSEAVRTAAAELEGVEFEARGVSRLRNVAEPVRIFAAIEDERSPVERQIDPVCRMVVAEGRAAGALKHAGREYVFCSLECVSRFARDPDAYAPGAASA